MADEKPKLTPDQQRGVATTGKRLLMSAAAGSGKTRVLAERCAYLVCEAPTGVRCDIDELLVVTFTEAAATEMRDRIGRSLDSKLRNCSEPHLERQRHLLEQAQISTLHSFCAQLLRRHFHLVGLDPAFTVMDEQEAMLLRLDVGRAMLRRRYSEDADGRFQRLLDGYVDGDDERLLQEIFHIHSLLGSLLDPNAWVREASTRIADAATGDFNQSELGKCLHDLLGQRIAGMQQRCESALKELKRLGDFPAYITRVGEVKQTCKLLCDLLTTEGTDAVAEMVEGITFDRLPAVPSSVPNKELAKGTVDAILKEFKDGSWRNLLRFKNEEWQAGLSRLQPHVQELLELVKRFALEYRRQKDEARQLDFADLERFSLRVLLADPKHPTKLEPSAAARHYRHIFKYVLVDEFQDINELQNAILHLVSREDEGRSEVRSQKSEKRSQATAESISDFKLHTSDFHPNLFAVGDVKQSIYRFRLADPEQFILREQTLRKDKSGASEVIDLKQNFRSRGPLLEAINSIFARLMTRAAAEIEYDDTQRLVPGRVFADPAGAPVFPGSPIELHLLAKDVEAVGDSGGPSATQIDDGDAGWDRTEREAAFVARRILQIVGKADPEQAKFVYDREKPEPRPAKFGDIVILLRSQRYKAAQFVRILEQYGVPTHADSGSGFFECTEVRDMVALLCLMDNQQQDLEMAAWLRSPLAKLEHPEDALATIRVAFAELPFYMAVIRYAENSNPLGKKLHASLGEIAAWRSRANRQPVHEVIWSIYHDTGYLAYVSGLPGGQQRSANLMELYDRARRFGTHRRQGLGRFLDYLKTLEQESDLGQPSLGTKARDVVRIMTIHASKGLEFPIVILPDCGKRINLRDEMGPILTDRHLGLGMSVVDEQLFARYPSLAQVVVKDRIHRKAMAEELRVLYVALTRAMEHLILVGTAEADCAESWREQWSGHAGPLPAATIVQARTMLDWLGPVWAASTSAGDPAIELESHPFETLEAPRRERTETELPPEVKALMELQPIASAPPRAQSVETLIQRLSYQYPHEAQTKERAARSVTSLVKEPVAKGGATTSAVREDSDVKTTDGSLLRLPAFFTTTDRLAAVDVGSATHLALQHLRFADTADRPAIVRQLDAMVADHKLPGEHRDSIDLAAIEWLLQSEIGQLLREQEPRLMRELPVNFLTGDAADPMDRTMVRGRIDLLVPTPTGLAIVDYKTDYAPTSAAVEVLANRYGPQLRMYAEALGRIQGKPVAQCVLVFLRARVIKEV